MTPPCGRPRVPEAAGDARAAADAAAAVGEIGESAAAMALDRWGFALRPGEDGTTTRKNVLSHRLHMPFVTTRKNVLSHRLHMPFGTGFLTGTPKVVPKARAFGTG